MVLYLIKNQRVENKIYVSMDQLQMFLDLGYVQTIPDGVDLGLSSAPDEETVDVTMPRTIFLRFRGQFNMRLKED